MYRHKSKFGNGSKTSIFQLPLDMLESCILDYKEIYLGKSNKTVT